MLLEQIELFDIFPKGMWKGFACDRNLDPLLQSTGKVEPMSFEMSRVSLYLHERIYPRLSIEADLVDCMVALSGQLFYSTQIPVCLWFLARNESADAKCGDIFSGEKHLGLAA